MKRGHLQQDPRLHAALAAAEGVLAAADGKATAQGLLLTDSNVRLILIQALEALDESGEPRRVHAHLKKKELFHQETAAALNAKFAEIQHPLGESASVTLEEWRTILRAMLHHVETESPRQPRARPYLDVMKRYAK